MESQAMWVSLCGLRAKSIFIVAKMSRADEMGIRKGHFPRGLRVNTGILS